MPAKLGIKSYRCARGVIIIPQYEYNILVITQVQGEAEDVGIIN